ncbi:MAG: hypothetical protein R3B55_00360 [Candidatus Paceibacterota bacterium]
MEKRTGEEWSAFVVKQQARIEERIGRYSNPETIKEQIKELKNLTPYQNYKISTMVPILQRSNTIDDFTLAMGFAVFVNVR